ALRIIRWVTRRLLLLEDALAVLDLAVIVFEVDGVESLDERQIKDGEVNGGLVADGAVVVPGVDRGQHHVPGPEGYVLAFDAGEIALASEAEADRVRRM